MWNNKKIKVLDNYSIANIKTGDIITVEGDYGCSGGKILTLNGEPYKYHYNNWCFPPNDGKYWEIIEEISITPEDRPNLIVGKWYKQSVPICSHIKAIKFKSWDTKYKGCPLHSGTILTNGTYDLNHNGGGIFNSSFGKALIECSLEEIQPYLPAGHPDKIVPKRPSKDDYITVLGLGYLAGLTIIIRYDNEYEGKFDETRCSGPNISDFNTGIAGKFVFSNNGGACFGSTSDRSWRLSTTEEKQWLDACIAKNAFVAKEAALTVKPKYEVGKWYKMSGWNSIGVRCSKVDTKIHYDAYISSTGVLNAQIGTYDFADNLVEVNKAIINKYLNPPIMYKFEIGQEVSPVKGKGNYFCNPTSFYLLPYETQKEYQGSGNAGKSKIKDRQNVNNTNWYCFEDYGNWVSEDGLESTTIETTSITKISITMKYPHPVGTKVLYLGKEHIIEAYYKSSLVNPEALISGPCGVHSGTGSTLVDEFDNIIHSDGKANKYFVPVNELTVIKETITSFKFKVGDRVIGNAKAKKYAFTTQNVTGVVTETKPTYFKIKIDEGFSCGGDTFSVEYESFDLYQAAKYPITPTSAIPKLDLKNTKIWIGNNPSLCQKVFDVLKKLGVDPRNLWKEVKRTEGYPVSFYIDENLALSYSSEDMEKMQTFNYNPASKVITLEELDVYSSPFDTEAIHLRISEIKQEEGDVEIGKVKRMLIPVKTI